jgi:hypothetical protein
VLFHHFERFVAEYERFEKAYGVVAVIQAFGDRIIDHLKLTFVAEKPPPSRVIEQVALMAAEERVEVLFLVLDIDPRQG